MSTNKPERDGPSAIWIGVLVATILLAGIIAIALFAGFGGSYRSAVPTGVMNPAETVAPSTPTQVSLLYRVVAA